MTNKTLLKTVLFFAMLFAASRASAQCACTYEGVQYGEGSVKCISGQEYVCRGGAWDSTGSSCRAPDDSAKRARTHSPASACARLEYRSRPGTGLGEEVGVYLHNSANRAIIVTVDITEITRIPRPETVRRSYHVPARAELYVGSAVWRHHAGTQKFAWRIVEVDWAGRAQGAPSNEPPRSAGIGTSPTSRVAREHATTDGPNVSVTVGRILSGGLNDRAFNLLNSSNRSALVTVRVTDPFNQLSKVQTAVLTVPPGRKKFICFGNPHTKVTTVESRFAD